MAKNPLLDFQQELYNDAFNEAYFHLKHQPRALQKYQQTFNETLPKELIPKDFKDFLNQIKPGNTILIGDFHPSGASQKAARNLIEMISKLRSDLHLQIGIEFFKAEHESFLDSYLNGQITELQLLKLTDYQVNWGFPWTSYGRLLMEIKNKKLNCFPFNYLRQKSRTMKSRDQKIAKKCWDSRQKIILETQKNPTQIILVGEHHLALDHLPKEMIKIGYTATDLIRVFCNLDDFYFEIQKMGTNKPVEIAQLDSSSYCIFNSAPWIKWKSLTIWHDSQEKHFETLEYDDYYFDIDHLFLTLTEKLASLMNLSLSKNNIENFNLMKTSSFDEHIKNQMIDRGISEEFIEEVQETIRVKGYAYIPQNRCLIIDDDNPNHLIELSGQHLFNCMRKSDKENIFLAKIIRFSFGFLARKIYDPNFSLHLMHQHKTFLQSNRSPTKSALVKRKRISAKATLRFCENLNSNHQLILKSFQRYDKATAGSVSRSIGKIIANSIFSKLTHQPIESRNILINLVEKTQQKEIQSLDFLKEFILLDSIPSGRDAA